MIKPTKEYEVLIEIKGDIKIIKDNITKLRIDSEVTKTDLRHHIKRTDLAEDSIKLLREENKLQNKTLQEQLQPIKRHVSAMEGAFKFIGLIATVLGIVFTVYKLFN